MNLFIEDVLNILILYTIPMGFKKGQEQVQCFLGRVKRYLHMLISSEYQKKLYILWMHLDFAKLDKM